MKKQCDICETTLSDVGKCFLCASMEKFLAVPAERHLLDAGVPPRTAGAVKVLHDGSVSTKDGSLYFYGPTGCGKTYQAAIRVYDHLTRYSCYVETYSRMKQVKFITVPELLDEIRQSYSKPVIKSDLQTYTAEELIMNYYKNADVLVLDDLGVEKPSDWVFLTLYLILNHRYEHDKTTIFTSNFSPGEFAKRIGDNRLTSRIVGWCDIVEFKDEDRRVNR